MIKAKIPNLVVNGNNNQINVPYTRSCLGNVVLNGSYNSIQASNTDFNRISVGSYNTVNNYQINALNMRNNFNMHNSFNTANINSNANHNNSFSHQLNDFINNVTEGIRNNQYEYNYSNDNEDENDNNEYEEENDDYEDEDENQEDNDNENKQLDERNEIILNLNEFQFKHANKYINRIEDKCAICLEKFNKVDIVKQFACGQHIFHKKCLFIWLKKSNICPLCKYCLLDRIVKETDD